MYALYNEMDPITAIEHSVTCHFIDASCPQLVTTGRNRLRVFRTNPYVLQHDAESNEWSQVHKLECLLSYAFLSPIRSLAAAKIPGSSRDALLLAFEDAKLSIIGFDEEHYEIVTLSMHCFEEEILKGGYTRHLPSPMVCADVESRCAVMLIYGKHLAVVPFKQAGSDLFDDDPTPSTSDPNKPSFYSYCISLAELDQKLINVKDFTFLHGYYEPTLLFLYEPSPTTVGRLAVRQDTHCIIAVSLNVRDRVHSVIWTVNMLPHDCFACQAVPRPIGGVLLIAVNSIIYLNQSVPPFGIAVNRSYNGMTAFPLRDMKADGDEDAVQIESLDSSAVTMMQPTCAALVTNTGKLYVLTILVDNTNAVKALELVASLDAVPPTCMCQLEPGVVFVGSRLADSLLLKYKETDAHTVKVASDAPMSKKPRREQEEDALDDLALYGEVVTVGTVQTMCVMQYTFEICATLLHIGPMRNMVVGSPAAIAKPDPNNDDITFDLVVASGHRSTGAVAVFNRTVRPVVVTSTEITGAQQLWTVSRRSDSGLHEFLLVSKQVSTMVLELSNEISELEQSGFAMQQTTIAAGDLDNGHYVVQVTPMTVYLVRGANRIHELLLDISFPVARAEIVDPYVILLTENGQILFVQLVAQGRSAKLVVHKPNMINQQAASAVSLYRDCSGLFTLSQGRSAQDEKKATSEAAAPHKQEPAAATRPRETRDSEDTDLYANGNQEADDEDALLYGEPSNCTAPADGNNAQSDNQDVKPLPVRIDPHSGRADVLFEASVRHTDTGGACSLIDPNDVQPGYWLVVARENGLLEIFSVPQMHCVFTVRRLPAAYSTLFDSDTIALSMLGGIGDSDTEDPPIRDIQLVSFGYNLCRPHLLVVIGDELVVYEAFTFDSGVSGRLNVRFRKHCDACRVMRNNKLSTVKNRQRRMPDGTLATFRDTPDMQKYPRFLYWWDSIGEYVNGGVFVAGPYPFWLFMHNEQLRVHPMPIEGGVRSFSAFNNANCSSGFLYLTQKDTCMRVCTLDRRFQYGAHSQPVWRIALECTVHYVAYMLDSHTYAVCTSTQKPHHKLGSMMGDEKLLEEQTSDHCNPLINQYKIDLYSPSTWQPYVGAGTLDMGEYEVVTCMKEVQLRSDSTETGFANYLAIGTTFNYGEECLVRGRCLIVEVIEVVPEPGQPAAYKFKTIVARDEKGPVSSLCSANGFMLTAMGAKIYIWRWEDNDLQGISFLDMHFYVHQMVGLRNLTLLADMYRSLTLLRYQEHDKAMSVASRDHRPVHIQALPMTIDFVVDNRLLAFIMTDEEDNLSLFAYQPEAPESQGGQKLLLRADMNLGTRISCSCRIHSCTTDPAVENKVQARNRHCNFLASLDGSISYLLPLPEKVFRRLHTLQQMLSTHHATLAGLNTKGARLARGYRAQMTSILAQYQQSARAIVDGACVFEYISLSLPDKLELAKRLGTTREQLTDDLLEIQRMTTHV